MAYKDEKCHTSRIYNVVMSHQVFFVVIIFRHIYKICQFSDRAICVYEHRLRMIKKY